MPITAPRHLTVILALLASACASGDDATAPPENGFRITLSSATPAIPLNSSALVTINVQRFGSFTGPIDLAFDNVASGISTFLFPDQIADDGSSGLLLIVADAEAAAGSRAFTIRATGTGAPAQTVSGSATITGQPTLALSFSIAPAAITVARGQTGAVGFSLTRGPGANAPIYMVTGPRASIGLIPANAAGQLEYPVVSSNGSILVAPDVALANGIYPVLLVAPLPGAPTQRATLSITVVDPS